MIITRHEQGAGFMAATMGRLTGKVGVCLATLGPGAANLVTAAAYAQLGGMPILMITGQKPIKKSKQGLFQIIDVIEMMRPITKSTKQIVNADLIPILIREAFRQATHERPGAVHLELPEDIAQENSDVSLYPISTVRRAIASDMVISKCMQLLHAAKRPLLLLGAGANRKRTTVAVRKFIDSTGIPFFNTQMGKGVIDERDEFYLGTAALSENDYLHCAIDRADLIINVGHDTVEKPPFLMRKGGMQVIHINFFAACLNDVYFPQLEVVGDIAHTLQKLSSTCSKQAHWDFSYYKKIKKEVEKHINEGSDDPRFPILPQRLVYELRQLMPSDGILTLDNGVYKIWFARNYKAHRPNTVLLDNALATMGAGLPSAIAAKLVYPTRQVVAVCGDGGFMMNSQELETAVRLKLHLIVLVLRDNAYGMIKWKQSLMDFDDYSLDFGNPDFPMYANCYGAQGHRLEKLEDFPRLFNNCLAKKAVHLIEIPIDYSENALFLGEKLKQRTCAI